MTTRILIRQIYVCLKWISLHDQEQSVDHKKDAQRQLVEAGIRGSEEGRYDFWYIFWFVCLREVGGGFQSLFWENSVAENLERLTSGGS